MPALIDKHGDPIDPIQSGRAGRTWEVDPEEFQTVREALVDDEEMNCNRAAQMTGLPQLPIRGIDQISRKRRGYEAQLDERVQHALDESEVQEGV